MFHLGYIKVSAVDVNNIWYLLISYTIYRNSITSLFHYQDLEPENVDGADKIDLYYC